MCGIAGIFAPRRSFAPGEAEAAVGRMNAAQSHRGPDGEGLWADPAGRCVLGHRRLAVIDTSDGGRQPMESADGRHVVVFNGEIYNYRELRDALAAAGARVAGQSDTAVLIAAIAHWGTDALARLDGMFAFALFDRVAGSLLLARDPFGEKPLYLATLPGGAVAFASELTALERIAGFDRTVSLDAVAELLTFQYVGAPRTIYDAATKLPPGHWLRIDRDLVREETRYFEFAPAGDAGAGLAGLSLDDLADALEDVLARSLARRMIADVPLGAFLSGGVDSSTACALVRRRLQRELRTFSLGFSDDPKSEHAAAAAFARAIGSDHTEIVLPHDVTGFLARIGGLLDEPNGDSSCLPTFMLSEGTRRAVTVAISGDGGDEMFAGYDRYFEMLAEERRFTEGRLPQWRASTAYAGNRILIAGEDAVELLLGAVPPGFRSQLWAYRAALDDPGRDLLARLRKADAEHYLPGAVLAKVDRMSMRHALEVRTPFLGVEVARFAEKLPRHALHAGGTGKRVLRRLAERYLPPALLAAPKRGFGIPQSPAIAAGMLAQAARQLGGDSRLRAALGAQAIDRFLRIQRDPGRHAPGLLWTVVMLEGWLRAHDARLPARPREAAAPDAGAAARTPARAAGAGRGPRARPRGPEALLAWPAGAGRFVVIEDDGAGADPAGTVPFHLADGLLRFVRFAALALAEPGGEPAPVDPVLRLGSGDRAIVLGGWGRRARDRVPAEGRARLAGATLLFPQSDVAHVLKRRAIRRFQQLGVAQLVFLDPDRDRAQLIRLRLAPLKSRWRSLRHALGLWRRNLGCWHWSRAAAGDGIVRARPVRLALVGDRPDALAVPRDYVVFEGLAPMVPAGPTDGVTGEPQRGQYALDARSCRFAPVRPRWWPPRLHWIAPLDAATWRLFDCVPTIHAPLPAAGDPAGDSPAAAAAAPSDGAPASDAGEPAAPVRAPAPPAASSAPPDIVAAVSALMRGAGPALLPPIAARLGRIVLLTGSLSPGGAERQWCYLAVGLRAAGFDVTVATMDALEGAAAHYRPLLAAHGITPVSLARRLGLDDVMRLAEDRALLALHGAARNPFGATLPVLVALLRETRPAALMAQMDVANVLGAVAGTLAGVPRIVLSARSVNPTNFSYTDSPLHLPLYRAIAAAPRIAWTANSRGGLADYAAWIGMAPERFALVPNAIDAARFAPAAPDRRAAARAALGIARDAPVIAGVFRFTEEKQPALFVEICAALAAGLPGLRVVIAGDGALRRDAERLARTRGIDRQIAFLGTRDDVADVLAAADLLLHTARIEGMPNAVMEAQAVGLPVVGFRIGGLPDIAVDGETGRIVAPGDRAAMTAACRALLRDADLRARMGAAAAARMRDRFSIAAMTQRFAALLDVATAAAAEPALVPA